MHLNYDFYVVVGKQYRTENQFHNFLKQINNKRKLVNLYKGIVLVTRLRIFCTTLITNNNIKVVIQMYAF